MEFTISKIYNPTVPINRFFEKSLPEEIMEKFLVFPSNYLFQSSSIKAYDGLDFSLNTLVHVLA